MEHQIFNFSASDSCSAAHSDQSRRPGNTHCFVLIASFWWLAGRRELQDGDSLIIVNSAMCRISAGRVYMCSSSFARPQADGSDAENRSC